MTITTRVRRVARTVLASDPVMVDCPDCDGERELICPGCRGDGSAGAYGRAVCFECKGRGLTGCETCNGSGAIEQEDEA